MLQKMMHKLRDPLLLNPFSPLDITKIVGSTADNGRRRMPSRIYNPEDIYIGQHVDIREFYHTSVKGRLIIGDRVLIITQGHPLSLPRWGKLNKTHLSLGTTSGMVPAPAIYQ